ncbi:MAG: AbrB/MazE/SpoVT family DNA-binding domain-containing protein [Bryobacteraceae bacterium]|jgi:bifunctional DNA-binding transcriptional regulator/antitoxin component of YhaV-PrlF toxin-antitoxin module
MEHFTVKVDGSGRILLPAKVRKQMNLRKDSTLIAKLEKQKLVLNTRAEALRKAQEFFSKLRPTGTLWSEELIRERREEARRELED